MKSPAEASMLLPLEGMLASLGDSARSLLVNRLRENRLVTMDNFDQYPFIATITQIVTDSCQSTAKVNRALVSYPLVPLLRAVMALKICRDSDIEGELMDENSTTKERVRSDLIRLGRPSIELILDLSKRGNRKRARLIAEMRRIVPESLYPTPESRQELLLSVL